MSAGSETIDLTQALNRFGLSDFRRGQRDVIEHVISGHDCLCVMPTGGGKSLCYQLPSLVRPGLTIVVSPLIALMKDQVDSLVRRGIRATLINSSLTLQEQSQRLEQVASGRYSMLYVAPERLRNPRFLDSIRTTPIQLLAIDEAHCISEWGHDFRPDYQRLGRFREALGNVQTIALTATATPKVRADILSSLHLESARTFITGFARDNLYFGSAHCMSDRDKDKQLHQFLEGRDESGIIYVATRKRCEALVDQLAKELQLSVGAYHAGLMPEQRKLVQDQFMAGKLKAIVATNAFGMGIDKPDLRYVVHYNMPGTLEAYYQEAGRAGRDGLLSQCVLLYNPQDRYIQEFFIENANPSRAVIQSVYEVLVDSEEDPIEMTADEIREQIGKVATAEAVNASLQILARTGIIERLEVAGGLAMFRLSSRLPSFLDLLPRDANVRRSVLRVVEKEIADRRDEAVYFHPRVLMDQLQMDRDTLFRHLRELTKLEDFEFAKPFRGRAIRFRRRGVPFDDLPIDHEALAQRKKADLDKLDQMVAYAKTHRCRQRTILDYFGDTTAGNCGICDRCQGKSGWPKMPPASKKATASDSNSSTPISNEGTSSPSNPSAAESQKPKATSKKSAPSRKEPADPQALRDAAQLLQTVLTAIERTHGYLSKTVLSQYFSGVASKAVTGLRLQRLPEFGLLATWKKSHASGLLDRMLELGLVHQSELRLGKQTVAITELGTQCIQSAAILPIDIVNYCADAMHSAATNTSSASPTSNPSSHPSDPPVVDRTPLLDIERPDPKSNSVEDRERENKRSGEPVRSREPAIRTSDRLPVPAKQDAERDKTQRSMLDDWQWSLRLVRHGYRLGECALIRGRTPDAVLADLIQAIDHGEEFSIDQLFDRRTALAIVELQRSDEVPDAPPQVFSIFPSLWPFVEKWVERQRNAPA